MNRKTLVADFANHMGIPEKTAQEHLDCILKIIEDNLILGNKITIQKFGRFETRISPATRRRNPRTGQIIPVAEKTAISFSASPELKGKVNWERQVDVQN